MVEVKMQHQSEIFKRIAKDLPKNPDMLILGFELKHRLYEEKFRDDTGYDFMKRVQVFCDRTKKDSYILLKDGEVIKGS